MTAERTPDARVEAVQTGWPLTHLIACTRCGSLLWDVDKHYADLHPAAAVVAAIYGEN